MLCCFALFVCLTLLASFFLPSHLSFKTSIYAFALPCLFLSNACVYSSLVVCVPRVSVSELEVDGLAVDVVNRQPLSLSAFCDQTRIIVYI